MDRRRIDLLRQILGEIRDHVQLTDVDEQGRRFPVLVTADPAVVAATERAIRDRVAEHLAPVGTECVALVRNDP